MNRAHIDTQIKSIITNNQNHRMKKDDRFLQVCTILNNHVIEVKKTKIDLYQILEAFVEKSSKEPLNFYIVNVKYDDFVLFSIKKIAIDEHSFSKRTIERKVGAVDLFVNRGGFHNYIKYLIYNHDKISSVKHERSKSF